MVQKTEASFVTQLFRAPCDRADIILLVNVPNRITSDWVTSGRVTSDWVTSDRVTSDRVTSDWVTFLFVFWSGEH